MFGGATTEEGAIGRAVGGGTGGAGIAGTVLGDNIDSIPRGDDKDLPLSGAGLGAGAGPGVGCGLATGDMPGPGPKFGLGVDIEA